MHKLMHKGTIDGTIPYLSEKVLGGPFPLDGMYMREYSDNCGTE